MHNTMKTLRTQQYTHYNIYHDKFKSITEEGVNDNIAAVTFQEHDGFFAISQLPYADWCLPSKINIDHQGIHNTRALHVLSSDK